MTATNPCCSCWALPPSGRIRRSRGNNIMRRDGRMFVSTSSSSQTNDLVEQIRESYVARETDGVLDLLLSSPSSLITTTKNDQEPMVDVHETLIPSILEAMSDENKGSIASVMNAVIGACCFLATDSTALKSEEEKAVISKHVQDLMIGYDELQKNMGVAPDIVSYSLAYSALECDPNYQDLASTILETALKQSKKQSGSKRRKTMASMRRKPPSTFKEAEPTLRRMLGSSFDVLLENDDLAVINKPSGVPCFHKKTTTAGKIKKARQKDKTDTSSSLSDISLEDALISCNVALSTLNPDALGLVHRLDRGSSGCLVLAKTDAVHARLMAEFFLRRTTKTYVALLQESSTSSMKEEGLIDHPVHGRPAKSRYRVLERNQSSGLSLVEFEIFTGRKHQIRVHAAEALSSPVFNDNKYGRNEDKSRSVGKQKQEDPKEQFFLHARRLTIPRLGIDVEAPIPCSWLDDVFTGKV
ncbi:pseudouridine synthase [Nitzschia inconspicua]|uniref:Pseudouridine synthase n=1 Tax=Nitzschia inconspicua TaxID=303405 RepID=A0A9K3L4N9_9STRA|nr:pseudouridine synthase [Nitzschia inconspicua]